VTHAQVRTHTHTHTHTKYLVFHLSYLSQNLLLSHFKLALRFNTLQ